MAYREKIGYENEKYVPCSDKDSRCKHMAVVRLLSGEEGRKFLSKHLVTLKADESDLKLQPPIKNHPTNILHNILSKYG